MTQRHYFTFRLSRQKQARVNSRRSQAKGKKEQVGETGVQIRQERLVTYGVESTIDNQAGN